MKLFLRHLCVSLISNAWAGTFGVGSWRKKIQTLFIYNMALLSFCESRTLAVTSVYFDDGQYHLISGNMYQDKQIYLDYYTANNPGTKLQLSNGIIDDIQLYNNSSFVMSSGTINQGIRTNGTCTVTMNGGSIGWDFQAYGNDVVNITGGSIGDDLFSRGNSIVTLSGGSVRTYIVALDNGIMYLDGSNLRVGGKTVQVGDSLRDYGVPGGTQNRYLIGRITGTLRHGSAINNTFYILNATNADIIVIPEPATMVLLGLGGMMLRRKH